MNLTGGFNVSPGKVEALLGRIRALGLNPALIEEQFVRGGGPGGQKINKTSNCVLLRYEPLGIVVRCQEDRQRSINRFLALRELVDQVEIKISPLTSRRLQAHERKRRSKDRAGRRARQKHRPPAAPGAP
jgi:protein subunit release factor B